MNGITHYDIKHSNILYYKTFNQKKNLTWLWRVWKIWRAFEFSRNSKQGTWRNCVLRLWNWKKNAFTKRLKRTIPSYSQSFQKRYLFFKGTPSCKKNLTNFLRDHVFVDFVILWIVIILQSRKQLLFLVLKKIIVLNFIFKW